MTDRWVQQYMSWFDVFNVYNQTFSREETEDMLTSGVQFCEQYLAPSNKVGDKEGLTFNPKTHGVHLPDGFHVVYQHMKSMGLLSMSVAESYGGLSAPNYLTYALMECQAGANLAFSTFPLLTQGAIDTLIHNADQAIIDRFVPHMVSGTWSGTMCLTEPQCGTDLGLIKTMAVKDGEHYSVTGNKIWITFGEHDLTENIIHLVLCKTPDAPCGTKGLSLFVVPKLIDGQPNGVQCMGLEHKMGSHASPTCVMSYNQAKGWLVGSLNNGLRAMFSMMNPARLSVGVQGLGAAQWANEYALQFCRDRRQGRSVNPERRESDQVADVITVHPDVRRMLLGNQAMIEAMRGVVVMAAKALDDKNDDLVSLMTPVIKSFLSEHGCACISQAIQVMGGAGYTQDALVEQYLRDARITMIYEGTNGVQAMDLVGRKLIKHGHALQDLIKKMSELSKEEGDIFKCLSSSLVHLEQANDWLMSQGFSDPESAMAVASDYLNLLGYVMCIYVLALKVKSHGDDTIADVFIHQFGPMVGMHGARIASGKYSLFNDGNQRKYL
ncbi:MAG: acyl-CoA dehydrogenase [Candidatus Comchoanobacterales bacterium]